MPHVVMLETASNQAYIFATNRQREQVGASQQIAAATTSWLLDALPAGCHPLAGQGHRGGELAGLLRDDAMNPPLSDRQPVELLTVTSGKSLLSCWDADLARSVVAGVTERALQEAPGLTIRGVAAAYGDGVSSTIAMTDAVDQVHAAMAEVRATVPPASWRFRQDPVTAVCRDSGLPATAFQRLPGEEGALPRSAPSATKHDVGPAGFQRMRNVLRSAIEAGHLVIPESSEARDAIRRPAVLHADGNSIGQLFALLSPLSAAMAKEQQSPDRIYLNLVRELSWGLDEVTRQAVLEALAVAAERQRQPVEMLPLIVGGDDVTVIVDGPAAWDLATAYLSAFERISASADGPLGGIARWFDRVPADSDLAASLGTFRDGLTASAGFAIVPTSYPFHAAYDLAEDATASAKTAKARAQLSSGRPVSAVDFHVHYDQVGDDLTQLRAARRGGGGATGITLSGGPYLLLAGRGEEVERGALNGGWNPPQLRRRDLDRVTAWRSALSPPDETSDARLQQLSRGTLRRLRGALQGGTGGWEAARAFLRPEQAAELDALERANGSLVTVEEDEVSTVLLDVLELIGAELIGEER